MDLFKASERLMGLNDSEWQRHASPWSVYTRFLSLPLLTAAIWSRAWLGWGALAPLALVIAFVWINPRLFPPPARTDNWAAKGTFGERVFLNRENISIPVHHQRWAIGLTIGSALGLIPYFYGLWAYDPGWTVAGMLVTGGAKAWFVDRMVWLYDDMKDVDPSYAGWLR